MVAGSPSWTGFGGVECAGSRRAIVLAVGSIAILIVGVLIVVWQAVRTRRSAPRLPAASGPRHGVVTRADPPLRLLVVGESSAVGVGVCTHEQALAPQIAIQLASMLGRTVQWRVIGHIGATARSIGAVIASKPALQADVIVLAIGANDAMCVRSPWRWHCDLDSLLAQLRRLAPLIALSPVPPFWQFGALPLSLRAVLGAQAFLLDCIAREIARRGPGCLYVPVPFGDHRELLSTDRFHPSAAGYLSWATHMAMALAHSIRIENTRTNNNVRLDYPASSAPEAAPLPGLR
jgi:lysophospholipase L1-like esterase